MNWIYNPKTKGSGIICCIPQSGTCPNNCHDCFFQSGRSYLEPLSKNLPHIPTTVQAEGRVVRMNDGNDSNNQRYLVESVAHKYNDVFFNTSIPIDIEKYPAPVVLTVNLGLMTNVGFHKLKEIPKNLMFIRFRTNTWNLGVLNQAVIYYTSRKARVIVTFMAYYNSSIPKEQVEFYTFEKRVTNSYWVINKEVEESIMSTFIDNPYVYACGYKRTHACKFCGNCLREYYRVKEKFLIKTKSLKTWRMIMGDTYIGECKKCGLETDLIMGICQNCVLKVEKTSDKLISVLCNPEGNVCIAGSILDRDILQECIKEVKKLEHSHNPIEVKE